GGVEPADHRVEPIDLGVDHQSEVEVDVGLVLLQVRPLLHHLDDVPPMDLDDLMHVDARDSERHQHLDDQLVAWRQVEIRWGTQPTRQLRTAVRGDAESLLRPDIVGVIGLHEPVALESLQRRVDLSDVERPHLAGPCLELLAKLQAIFRTFGQEREYGMADAHRSLLDEYKSTPVEPQSAESSTL